MLRTRVHRAAAGGVAAVTGLAGLAVLGAPAQAAAPVPLPDAGTIVNWGPGLSEAETGIPGGLQPLVLPAELANTVFVKALAGGPNVVLGLTADGHVVRAGTSVFGTTLPESLDDTVVMDIAADGNEGGAAVTADGGLITWGPAFTPFIAKAPTDITGATSVAVEPASGAAAAVVLEDGSVRAWGGDGLAATDLASATDDLSDVARVVAIVPNNMFAIKTDGTLVGWGSNSHGQLSLPSVTTNPDDGISVVDGATVDNSVLALLSDNTLVKWGARGAAGTDAMAPPAPLQGKTVEISRLQSSGMAAFMALTSDDEVHVWGIGTENETVVDSYTTVPDGLDASKVVSLHEVGWGYVTALVTKILPVAKPTIAGTAKVGEALTATPGTFSGVAPEQVTGEWHSGGEPTGDTDTSYEPTTDDIGNTITYVSSALNGATPVTSESAPTAAVAPAEAPEKIDSTTTVSAPASTYGRAATVTVKVSNTGGRPLTGNVTLSGAGAAQPKAVGADGTATFALPRTLRAGTYSLTATYAGSTDLNTSVGKASLRIGKATPGAPSVKVTKKSTRKKAGKATVRVATPAGLAAASGKVTVTLKLKKTTKRAVGTLRAGTTTVKLPKLPKKGKWKVTVTYSGDANYNARSAGAGAIRVR